MPDKNWFDAGPVGKLKSRQLQQIMAGKARIALVFKNGEFSAVSGECNHEGGPLGRGRMAGEHIVCPWHGWSYHRKTGHAPPPGERDCLPRHEVQEKSGHLFIKIKPSNKRVHSSHPPHPLARAISRKAGPIRIAAISTTPMDKDYPRYSTSENLLLAALTHARSKLKAETKLIKLRDLTFHHCGGFYSIDERACTWPCTFSQADKKDQLGEVYEALVFWADVILVATPIRWGNASSLYYKMAERLNCIQNQVLLHNTTLIKNKVAAFIITGGQDNVQAVAGNMMMFFGQLGFVFPQNPFIGHSRGWAAEDMDNNVTYVRSNEKLKQEARDLAERAINTSKALLKKKP
jgi:nitrite reductase/ring-hydroxylating ferredoxin subunit/multimeric flavodoxin WrbA